ncbi:STAS domain-containing protein [Nonomuraea wenchangensis]
MNRLEERLLYQDEQLKATVRAAAEGPVVTLVGQVDASNSWALAVALTGCSQGRQVVVDPGGLTFIDVSGLRVLALPGLPPERRWIRLCNLTSYQLRLLRLMGWHHESRAHRLPI